MSATQGPTEIAQDGRTRMHLDRVEGLGHFLELEVVLQESEPCESGAHEAHALMDRLGIQPSDLIETAYVDLLAQSAAPAHARLEVRSAE